jgi:hypothetical protein
MIETLKIEMKLAQFRTIIMKMVDYRFAKWYMFNPKIPNWVILESLAVEDVGIFCGNLVYFPRFGMLYQENSGNPGRRKCFCTLSAYKHSYCLSGEFHPLLNGPEKKERQFLPPTIVHGRRTVNPREI